MTDEEQEQFEDFLFTVDDSIDQLSALMGLGDRRLDFSPEALDRLEDYLISHEIQEDDAMTINMAAQYLGEFMVKNFGGKWYLCDDPDNEADYGLPVIRGHNGGRNDFSPIPIIENLVVVRVRGLLRSAVSAEFDDFDFGIEPEE